MRVVHYLRETSGDPKSDHRRLLDDPETPFGENVRRMRLAAGWTQRELAELLLEETGVKLDVSAITRIERGRNVSLRQALALSYTLNAIGIDVMLMEPDERDLPSLLDDMRRGAEELEENIAAWRRQADVGSTVLETRRRQIAEVEAQIAGEGA